MTTNPNLSVVPNFPREEPPPSVVSIHAQEILCAAISEGDFPFIASSVTGQLARNLHCDHVMIGWRHGHSCKLEAWSGNADLREDFALVRQVAAAMDEAIDQHASLRFPPHPSDPPRITLMQSELVSAGLGRAICTLPLVVNQKVLGAITLIRAGEKAWTSEELLALEDLLVVLAGTLALKRRSEESLLLRCRRGVVDFGRHLLGRGYMQTKLSTAALLLALAAACFIPVTQSVTAQARTEGIIQRSLSAPVDSFIKEVYVRPGDEVREGAHLLSLSDQDLRTEQRRLESELARYQSDYAEAFAAQDRARMVANGARVAETQASVTLIELQLSRIDIYAPFDGMIIKGDLQQQIGAPVKRGDVLLVMSPGRDFRVILEVPERDIGNLRTGMVGRLHIAAIPDASIGLRIDHLTPISRLVDGTNVFEVQASLQGNIAALRPGMEGVAKIDLARRPLAYIWGRRSYDWLKFKLWTWLG